VVEFEKQDPLPYSEQHISLFHRDSFTGISHKHSPDVRMPIKTFFFTLTHRLRIPIFQIIMLISFIDRYVFIAPLPQIIPETVLCFIDLQDRSSVSSEYAYQSVLSLAFFEKRLYLISKIYNIKRPLGMNFNFFSHKHF